MALLKETNDPCTSVIVHPIILITAAAQRAEASHCKYDTKYKLNIYESASFTPLIRSMQENHRGSPGVGTARQTRLLRG